MDPHTAAAIAQIVFYVPLVPFSIYLLVRNWKYGPRTAWYPAVPFTLVRLISAILTVVEEQNPGNRSLIIATIVLLNIGLVPLILSYAGITRLVIESSLKGDDLKSSKRVLKIVRLNIFIAVGLLSTSGSFAGQPDKADIQKTLSIVAYIQFAALVVILTATCFNLHWRNKAKEADRIYLEWALISSVLVAIRTIYGLLSVFLASGNNILTSIWSPLFGSAVAYSCMALIPEYVALCIYLYLSMHRLRTCKAAELADTEM